MKEVYNHENHIQLVFILIHVFIYQGFGDYGLYWRLNEKRFFQSFRDQSIIQAVENRLDKVFMIFHDTLISKLHIKIQNDFKTAGQILSIVLKHTDARFNTDKANQNAHISKTITAIDVVT